MPSVCVAKLWLLPWAVCTVYWFLLSRGGFWWALFTLAVGLLSTALWTCCLWCVLSCGHLVNGATERKLEILKLERPFFPDLLCSWLFFGTLDKIPDKRSWRGKRFILAHSLKIQSVTATGACSNWSHCSHSEGTHKSLCSLTPLPMKQYHLYLQWVFLPKPSPSETCPWWFQISSNWQD